MNNGSGSATEPLLGSSFNAIAVGLSNGNSRHGSYPLATTPTTPYASARTRPDLVAPADYTSYATPIVRLGGRPVGGGGAYRRPRPVHRPPGPVHHESQRRYHLQCREVRGRQGGPHGRGQPHRPHLPLVILMRPPTNGLNSIYGAGQLNIYNSYHIIAAGEQNSLEDAPGTHGNIGSYRLRLRSLLRGRPSSGSCQQPDRLILF